MMHMSACMLIVSVGRLAFIARRRSWNSRTAGHAPETDGGPCCLPRPWVRSRSDSCWCTQIAARSDMSCHTSYGGHLTMNMTLPWQIEREAFQVDHENGCPYLLNRSGILPCPLHAWGSQLRACPCQCRVPPCQLNAFCIEGCLGLSFGLPLMGWALPSTSTHLNVVHWWAWTQQLITGKCPFDTGWYRPDCLPDPSNMGGRSRDLSLCMAEGWPKALPSSWTFACLPNMAVVTL